MRARLTLEAGDGSPVSLDLAPGQPITLGRSRDSSIVLRDDLASRLHAKIYYEDGRWVVRDFGLNGTRVGGLRISGAVPLSDDSQVQIGDAVLRFKTIATVEPTRLSSAHTQTLSDIRSSIHSGYSNSSGVGTIATLDRKASETPPPGSIAGQDRRLMDGIKSTRACTTSELEMQRVPLLDATASQLKVDELTALCRFMTAAVETPEPHDLIRLGLRAILNQTTAKVAGYLSLDPTDPTPKYVLPEMAAVDVPLSRRLTERIRSRKQTVWLSQDSELSPTQRPPTESLSAFTDAICLPIGSCGETYAALHVYRTGMGFSERDLHFIEVVGGYLGRALELHRHRRKLEAENNRLRATVLTADELIGDSNAMMMLRQQIAKVAPLTFTALIFGESGSGKEHVAQALHTKSNRSAGPLVVVNCAAISSTYLEAELFGYRKGAFNGADRDHFGLFERADEGTLFLDEVGELTLECQAKLLRVIEGKPFRNVGGTHDVKVDVRVIAATHRDLDREAKAGRFRQDLLFRLKVIPLKVPSLRDHSEDIPELARFFLERLSVQCRRTFKITSAALRKLQAYSWPGNVRQLRAVLESSAVMGESETIDAADLAIGTVSELVPASDVPPSLDVDELETWAIRKALKQTGGNVSRSAQVLGISRDTLHTKLKKKGISREDPGAIAPEPPPES